MVNLRVLLDLDLDDTPHRSKLCTSKILLLVFEEFLLFLGAKSLLLIAIVKG